MADEGTRFAVDMLEEDVNEFGTMVPIKVDYESEGKKKDMLMLDRVE